jgi:transposase
MGRRVFSREFKIEAVRLIRERGVSVAQSSWDLDIHQNVLRQMDEGVYRGNTSRRHAVP